MSMIADNDKNSRSQDAVAQTLVLERLARVVAAWPIAANADGSDPSVAHDVDSNWPDAVEQSIALLKAIREPDAAMVAVGDGKCWGRMIEAAIRGRASLDLPRDT